MCDSAGEMKFRKATGPTKVVIQMLIASSGMDMKIANLTNSIIRDGKVQKDPEVSRVINLYKGKGDALGRGNFTNFPLLEHVMKVLGRVVEMQMMICSLGSRQGVVKCHIHWES